jgi:DNA mismatch repair protein MutS2
MKKRSSSYTKLFTQAQYLLEFNKILNLASEFAISADAKSGILNLIHADLIENPEVELNLIEQIREFLSRNRFTLDAFEDVSREIHFLSIEQSTLSIESFERIYKLCHNTLKVTSIPSKEIPTEYQDFISLIKKFPDLKFPLKCIKLIFDEHFEIMDHASAELKKIRDDIKSLEKSIHRTFKKELESIRSKGFLAEGEESIRNGRYVFRVLAEHKRKIPGIIVDESDSGKSIFIEPQVCLELNNELISLEIEEKREVAKILLELTNKLRSFSSDFGLAYGCLVDFDILLAKALFAVKINGIKPAISFNKKIQIEQAFHPLLYLKFKDENKKPVPLSFYLQPDNHLLLISGPNAGGKTIVLKTFGLLQLMLQRGFLIPVGKNSVFPVFHDIWVDIGDWQSLDDGLSTYSAKLSYMKILVESANENSLVLIDELGSGTEPIIGGAIAESVLSELVKLRAYGIITTHYANLKAFAHKTKGVINGAMVYDEQKMEPKYQLQVGKPGSSYALDIANKLKFPKHLVQYAKNKAGKNLVNMEALISKLEEEKANLESKNNDYLAKINSLNKLIKAYDNIQKQYEIKRLKLKLDSKQLEYQQQNYLKQETQHLLNEIKEKLDLIKAKQLQEDIIKKSKELASELHVMSHEYNQLLNKGIQVQEIKTGDKVHLMHHNMIGTVTEIGERTAKVITEHFTIKVNKSELSPVKESLVSTKKQKIQFDLIESVSALSSSIDLRGQTPQDALKALDHYFDKAIMSNVKEVKILHGKGTGVLRNAIHQSLRKNKFVDRFVHPDEQDGGAGITLVTFK